MSSIPPILMHGALAGLEVVMEMMLWKSIFSDAVIIQMLKAVPKVAMEKILWRVGWRLNFDMNVMVSTEVEM